MSTVRRITRARIATPVALAIVVLSAFAHGAQPRRIETMPVGVTGVSVTAGVGRAPGAYFSGGTLFVPGRRPVRLSATPSAPMTGWLSPAIVPAPDDRTVFYSTWRQLRADDPAQSWSKQGIAHGDALGTPEIRCVDLASGKDEVFVSGATSPMVSSTGAVAYVRGASSAYRAGVPYAGTIEVRTSGDARPVVWAPAVRKYAIAAWAGAHLLAYEIAEGEALSLVAIDAPGRLRSLGPGTLVAVSPGGKRALVERSDLTPASVAIVDVASGRTRASLEIAPAYGIDALSYAGAWTGRTVVARTGSGLAFFEVGANGITVAGILDFDHARYPSGVIQPRFAGNDDGRVVAFADEAGASVHAVALVCARATRTCASFPMGDAAQPAFNPSAPAFGRGTPLDGEARDAKA